MEPELMVTWLNSWFKPVSRESPKLSLTDQVTSVSSEMYIIIVQWNLDILVTLGTVLPGCYTLGDLLIMQWSCNVLSLTIWDFSLLIFIDQEFGLYRWPLT